MRTTAAVASLISLLLFAPEATAWGVKGHRIIAAQAERRLAKNHPKVLQRIEQLVGPGVTLASLSTCADDIRAYTRMRAGGKADAPFLRDCLLSRAEMASKFPNTSSWHYVNIPLPSGLGDSTVLEQACGRECITAQIDHFTQQLGNNKLPAKTRAVALMFLIHLVGDIHQPLHAVERNKDQGGNLVIVSLGGAVSTLHALWDTKLVESLDGRLVSTHVKKTSRTPQSWAWESYEAARDVVYWSVPARPGNMKDPILLPEPEYRNRAVPVVRQRLHAASVRLADLLAKTLAR
jgi:S1/P1 Nuclease